MNKVVYADADKNIPGFAEAIKENGTNFMWDILNLMDRLYQVEYSTGPHLVYRVLCNYCKPYNFM